MTHVAITGVPYDYSFIMHYGTPFKIQLTLENIIITKPLFTGVPYDCSSIMHYGTETFSIGGQDYPTMKRKHSDCDLRFV